jgi:hypothetical protein
MTDVHPFGLMLLAVVISSAVNATKVVVRSLVPSFTPKKTLCGATKTFTVMYCSTLARFYNELVLHVLPYGWAAVLALIPEPFTFGPMTTYAGRLFLAFFAATFAALIYRASRKMLTQVLLSRV